MTPIEDKALLNSCDAARQRLFSVKGDPFLFADWKQVIFLHFLVEPQRLRPYVPAALELELHGGQACFSLVALTMRQFRPSRRLSLGWAFRPIATQRFLNFRTYVRHGNEPGALFIRGWLSQPFAVRLPSRLANLPYSFASLDYNHAGEAGALRGVVTENPSGGRFAYHACVETSAAPEPCAPGSLADFAMERYTGFFVRQNRVFAFRAWHPPWFQVPLEVNIEDGSLLVAAFPWFKQATLAGANFSRGFERVSLGRAHRLDRMRCATRSGHRLSAFYKMP